MARRRFGGDLAAYVISKGAGDALLLEPGAVVTFWTAKTGGEQLTSLLDEISTPISQVTADSDGALPEFFGPDTGPETWAMWADASGGAGPRRLILSTELGTLSQQIAVAQADVGTVQVTIAGLATVASTGQYDDLAGAPALAAVATSGAYSDLSGRPPLGLQIVTKVGGSWPVRASTAPDTTRPAMWIGPAPAPPSTGGYALAGDLWTATPA